MAEKNGLVTDEMRVMHAEHVEQDRIQRGVFKAEKAYANTSQGLLVCILDLSSSQETPSVKAIIGS